MEAYIIVQMLIKCKQFVKRVVSNFKNLVFKQRTQELQKTTDAKNYRACKDCGCSVGFSSSTLCFQCINKRTKVRVCKSCQNQFSIETMSQHECKACYAQNLCDID